jgi:predicted metal-dependent hydrolase
VTEAIPEPELSPEEREALDRGTAEFNAGRYFECHDTLEDLWSGIRGPSRDFFQGLIQVSVGFYHLTNGNPAGAASLLARALGRFTKYPAFYFGLDLSAHRTELRRWLERLSPESDASLRREAPPFPKWSFRKRPAGES